MLREVGVVDYSYGSNTHTPRHVFIKAVDFVEERLDGMARKGLRVLNARPPEDFSVSKRPLVTEESFPLISFYDQLVYMAKDNLFDYS